MRVMVLFFVAVIWSGAAWPTQGQASPDAPPVRVRATGQAPADLANAKQAAIEDALRRAVEVGGGLELASESEASDFRLIRDVILTRATGYIRRYEVLDENPNQDGLYTVRVEAEVSGGDIDADALAFKAMLRRKGDPKLVVVGSVDGRPFDGTLTAEIQGVLEQRGLFMVDPGMLAVVQRRQAELAARVDDDPAAAARILEEVGAHYLVVLDLETALQTAGQYGLTTHAADATGVVKVLAADTAQVIASTVTDAQAVASTERAATREAERAALLEGTDFGVQRIAAHWLDDLAPQGGQQIELIITGIDFPRLDQLVRGLGTVDGVMDVTVDSMNAASRSQLRVRTHHPASAIAAEALRLDPGLYLNEATLYQLFMTAGPADGTANGASLASPALWIAAGTLGVVVIVVGLLLVARRGGKPQPAPPGG